MGNPFKKPKTKQTRKVPKWVESAAKDTLSTAQRVADTPYTPYTGQRVAPLSANEQRGIEMAGGSVGQYQEDIDRARNLFRRGEERFTDADIQAYMNPYIKGALDPAARELREDAAGRVNQLRGQAASRGAFGGGRATLMEEEAKKTLTEGLGDLYGRGYAQAFESGADRWAADRDAAMGAGRDYVQLALREQGLINQDIQNLMATGGVQRGVEQAMSDFDYQQFVEGRDWDLRNIDTMLTALNGISNSYTVTNESKQSGGELGQILGLAATAYGAYASGGLSLLGQGAASGASSATNAALGNQAINNDAVWGGGALDNWGPQDPWSFNPDYSLTGGK
jgi:hypothetical protein